MSSFTVGKYLLHRLEQIGLRHIFGVPGDYILEFFDQIIASNIDLINTCNELNASYAADGYARINGVGCVAVTYAVGGFSALNGIAGAYAEHVPVVVLSGSPKIADHKTQRMLHHTVDDFNLSHEIYKKVTVDSAFINDPEKAPEEIDRVLKNCLVHKRPVYLELCRDVTLLPCKEPGDFDLNIKWDSDSKALEEAVSKAVEMLSSSKAPIVIPGLEIKRFRYEEETQKIIDRTGYPFATMILGKTVLPENHPQFIGHYFGEFSKEYIKNRIHNADAVLMLGTYCTDANYGGYTAKLDDRKTIKAHKGLVQIGDQVFDRVNLKDFLDELWNKLPAGNPDKYDIKPASESFFNVNTNILETEPQKRLSNKKFYEIINSYFKKDDIVLGETGTSIFSLADVMMPDNITFVGQAFYASIGYTVGAALGTALADPKRRTLLFVGDGSFQLTCQEVSTMIRNFVNPVIFLINNEGYTIERLINDGAYNNLQPWKYHMFPEAFGGAKGYEVTTEGELVDVLEKTKGNQMLTFVEVHLDKWDYSGSLKELVDAQKKDKGLSKV